MTLRRFLSAEDGSALVEVALALPLLAMVLGGTVDFGLYEEFKMQVIEAANAGAAFGAQGGNQINIAGMRNAAATASPSLSNLVVTAASVWTCSPGGAAVSSGASCTNGETPLQYVVVGTTANVNAPLPLASLGTNMTVRGQATYRVRWKPS